MQASPPRPAGTPGGVQSYSAAGKARPVPVVMSAPRYLPAARYARLVGTVIVRASISPEGLVTAVSVIKGVDSLLDAPAVRAAKLWQFKVVSGASRTADISFTFRLTAPETVSYVPPFSVTIQGGPLETADWE